MEFQSIKVTLVTWSSPGHLKWSFWGNLQWKKRCFKIGGEEKIGKKKKNTFRLIQIEPFLCGTVLKVTKNWESVKNPHINSNDRTRCFFPLGHQEIPNNFRDLSVQISPDITNPNRQKLGTKHFINQSIAGFLHKKMWKKGIIVLGKTLLTPDCNPTYNRHYFVDIIVLTIG